MSSNIDELYKIQKNNVGSASQVLKEAFFDDPAWIYVFPDEDERNKRLPYVFEYIIRYAMKYGMVYAPTENLEGIAIWTPYTTVEKSAWRILRSGAFKAALRIGGKAGKKVDELFGQIEKDRQEYMKNESYLYLEAIGILPKFQGQGFGGKLLKSMFSKADRENLLIYLETETEQNHQMYSKYGFQTVKTGVVSVGNFLFWEMVRIPKNLHE
jgi:GNAT superfamily N-acetyltransferase